MPKADKVDLIAGLIIIAFGLYFLIGSFEYRMGTVARMGPGYIPFALGAISVVLGVLITGLAIGRDGDLPVVSFRAPITILLSIIAFGFLLNRIGLVPATFIAVIISMHGDPDARAKVSITAAAIVAFFAWLVFVAVLGLQMRAFRMPF
jgi:hypothetical protein